MSKARMETEIKLKGRYEVEKEKKKINQIPKPGKKYKFRFDVRCVLQCFD